MLVGVLLMYQLLKLVGREKYPFILH